MAMTRPLSLTVLGGAREIGANCYHLDLGGAGILLDAGMHPKRVGKDALPDLDRVGGDVDAILISHAHLDHVGSLPVALQCFPRARAYMTRPTSLLAIRMLRNAVAVSRSRGDEEPLFSHDHVEWVAQVVRTLEPEKPVQLDLAGGVAPEVTFFSAGHVLGAVGILVEHQGRRIFYTGDTCGAGQYICGPARYPSGPVDLLLLDSTHGADRRPNLKKDRRAFGRATSELGTFISDVAERNGVVLMPVFALGRTQEILGVLHELGQRGKIPPLPIYISGLAHAIGRIYDATRHDSVRRRPSICLEGLYESVFEPSRVDDPSLLERPSILAVASGMMYPNTTSNALAGRILPDPRHGVAFVGFLDPDSPGHRVAAASDGEMVDLGNGASIETGCSVRSFGFTAHSRASQLMQLVRELEPKRVVLVHGDEEAVRTLHRSLEIEGWSAIVAEPGVVVEV
jgi:Cft2 family RNA processing exonuclease